MDASNLEREKQRSREFIDQYNREKKSLEEGFAKVMAQLSDRIPQTEEHCLQENAAVDVCYQEYTHAPHHLYRCADTVREYARCAQKTFAQWEQSNEALHEHSLQKQADGEKI